MSMQRKAVLAAAMCSAFVPAACGTPARDTPGLILHHGRIVTLSSASTIAEAVAIEGDRIAAVGKNEDILSLAGTETELVDLGGQTVVPGFADNHYHGIGGGPGVDLASTRRLAEVLEAIAARARDTPPGDVILTNRDWHEGQLEEQRLPYRDDLDSAAPNHPVVVVRGGHEYVLNSAALTKWRIDESTDAPEGGSIGRYDDGRLNGELVDTAKSLVELPADAAGANAYAPESLSAEHRRLNEVGLTSIRYASGNKELYDALAQLRDRGELTVRASVLFRLTPSVDLEKLDEVLESWGVGPDDGDAWLRVGGIKLGVDGGFEGGWMREPYSEPYGENGTYYGLQTFPTVPFVRLVRALNLRGWRVATHAVGDAAIDLVLDGYQMANEDRSTQGSRWAIEHAFIVNEEQVSRIKELGLAVSGQHHLYLAAPSLVKYWGAGRAHRVTPLRSYLDAGIPVSLGTDSPVVPYPPLGVLYHFITRETMSAGVMGEDQRLGREEALRAMTLGYAHLTFEEKLKGSIEPGKLADLVVLPEDILTCPPERVRDMLVSRTIVGGETVYARADSFSISR
jgi:predicted amidohydrolase YtcJ